MRRCFLTGPLLMLLMYARGQDQRYVQPPALALHFVFNDFVPVTVSQGTSFHETKAGLAASYINGISRRVDVMGTVTGSILQFPFRKGVVSGGQELLLLEGDISIRYKLLPCYHWISPYSRIGFGASDYQGRIGLLAPVGIGVQVNLNPYTFLLFDAQYRVALTREQTGHFIYSMGLGGIIRKKIMPAVRKTVPAPILAAGSPAESKGSTDSDGDGIPDDKDKCPWTPGWVAYDGCPPPLGDNTIVRPRDTAWSIAERLHAAAQRVYFATGKYVLLSASYPALGEVAGMLKEYPSLRIEVQGHTDSVGEGSDNQLLSQRRAEVVMQYLSGKGAVGKQRLRAIGFGPTKPIATNATEEGRALNRRVEFKVVND